MIRNDPSRKRNLSLLTSSTEHQLPVPWGHIAYKHYPKLKSITSNPTNPKSSTNATEKFDKSLPVLCFHGWLDNANSFERVIPLIQQVHPDLEFYSFDFPGHGKSSHRPDGVHVTSIETYVMDIHFIVKYFKLEESGFNTMAHSMGGNAVVQYSCLFPGIIKNLIRFDVWGLIVHDYQKWTELTAKTVLARTNYDFNKKFLPERAHNTYTYDEAKKRVLLGTKSTIGGSKNFQVNSTIDEDSIDFMLPRGLIKLDQSNDKQQDPEDKYRFSRDVKLLLGIDRSFNIFTAKSLISNYGKPDTGTFHNEICIMASENIWEKQRMLANINDTKSDYDDNFYPWGFYENNPNFQLVCVEGKHHVHLNNPEIFIDKLNEWIGDPKGSRRDTMTAKEYWDLKIELYGIDFNN